MPSWSELQQTYGEAALRWIVQQNALTEKWAALHPEYQHTKLSLLERYANSTEVVDLRVLNNKFYIYLEKNKNNHRGILKKIKCDDYHANKETAENLLDIDVLAKNEAIDWSYHSIFFKEIAGEIYLLVGLSESGSDQFTLREFDIKSKAFVNKGFEIPKACSDVEWLTRDSLLLSTNCESVPLTYSGHPSTACILKRGQTLTDAHHIFKTDLKNNCLKLINDGEYRILIEELDFYRSKYYLLNGKADLKKYSLLPIPTDAVFLDFHEEMALFRLPSKWNVSSKKSFKANSIIGIDLEKFKKNPNVKSNNLSFKLCFEAPENSYIGFVGSTSNYVFLTLFVNLKPRLLFFNYRNHKFHFDHELLDLPEHGNLRVVVERINFDEIIFSTQDFLIPERSYHYKIKERKLSLIGDYDLDIENLNRYRVTRCDAVSKDGTRIPYFMIASKSLNCDGCNPVLMYGYGGFGDPQESLYVGSKSQYLLDKGFVYVVACIRGGGEFGDKWRDDGIGKNKQNSFDDFIAVGKDLIANKVTSPAFLAISGASNGGLLVGACAIQEPELFGAVICDVPVLDMLNYPYFGAGHLWISDYGDPANPADRAVIEKYSPLQNIKADVKYPPMLIHASTSDDRTHPYHARVMAHELQKFNNTVLYCEDKVGGHTGNAECFRRVNEYLFMYLFLYEKILLPASIARSNVSLLAANAANLTLTSAKKRSRDDEVKEDKTASFFSYRRWC